MRKDMVGTGLLAVMIGVVLAVVLCMAGLSNAANDYGPEHIGQGSYIDAQGNTRWAPLGSTRIRGHEGLELLGENQFGNPATPRTTKGQPPTGAAAGIGGSPAQTSFSSPANFVSSGARPATGATITLLPGGITAVNTPGASYTIQNLGANGITLTTGGHEYYFANEEDINRFLLNPNISQNVRSVLNDAIYKNLIVFTEAPATPK